MLPGYEARYLLPRQGTEVFTLSRYLQRRRRKRRKKMRRKRRRRRRPDLFEVLEYELLSSEMQVPGPQESSVQVDRHSVPLVYPVPDKLYTGRGQVLYLGGRGRVREELVMYIVR